MSCAICRTHEARIRELEAYIRTNAVVPPLTVRDAFAAAALPVALQEWLDLDEDDALIQTVAKRCYGVADAMLAARVQEPGK